MDTDQPSRILQKQSQAGLVSTDWLIVYKQIPGQLFCDLLYLKMYFDSYLSTLFLRNKINLVCSVSIFYVCGSGQFLLFLVVHLVGFSQTAWNEFLSHKSHVQRGTRDNGSGHKHLVSSCHDNIFNLTFSSSPNWVWPWWESALNNARSESRNYFHCWRC